VRRVRARLTLRKYLSREFWFSRTGIIVISIGILCAVLLGILAVYYHRFSRMIDTRLSGEIYGSESRIFASPKRISVGEMLSSDDLVRYLQSVGYSNKGTSDAVGWYRVAPSSLVIFPSHKSYFAGKDTLRVDFSGRRISQLRYLPSLTRLISAEIEPELISSLFGRSREKRRPLSYGELPKTLIDAVLSAEDKRFFDHPGFDPIRILGAARADLKAGEKAQGASTITMQMGRGFFFTTKREWSRKIKETLMALLLEHRFDKKQIFELYANDVYLGNRGSFAIHGFGEAAQAYFAKDVRELNLAQCCFLAGIIRAPNRYSSADRKPERAAEARDRVLAQMLENGLISSAQEQEAKKADLRLVSGSNVSGMTGYFVDMVKDDLLDRFSENELRSMNYRIYTTLDADLQRCAMQAVDFGMKKVDARLAGRYALWQKRGEEAPPAQVALVALDPHTGGIKALVGGRDYAKSQLNHAIAERQPGSVFKPFVYATAFEGALEGKEPIMTPASTVMDEPVVFNFEGKEYTPNNYDEKFYGKVTLRNALVHSLNVATVKVAETAGYDRVVSLAKRMGLEAKISPTPALALGAYEATPLDIAAGYTAFANFGTRCEVMTLQSVEGAMGDLLEKQSLSKKFALDPRVSYLITNILEDVLNRGTGAGVRTQGFRSPAAGKTGTSHDGWFAGYTTNLLCVVWVGFDDNRELGLSGAESAAPIWAEFMKRAVRLPRFNDVQQFERPEGVVSVTLDSETQQLATTECPSLQEEVFIAGTEPTDTCSLHGASLVEKIPPISWLKRLFSR
jgi:penicillin-binding protein 1B